MTMHETFGDIATYPPQMIALAGPAGSGKSTLAALLAERYGYHRTRFAGPLKAMARGFYTALGMDGDEIERRIEGDLKELADPALFGETPRYFMQALGTEFGRNCMGKDFWINAWSAAAKRLLADGEGVVVEDCRFDNEAAAVRALGGVVIGISCPWAAGAGNHASEAGVAADVTIANDQKQNPQAMLEALRAAGVV